MYCSLGSRDRRQCVKTTVDRDFFFFFSLIVFFGCDKKKLYKLIEVKILKYTYTKEQKPISKKNEKSITLENYLKIWVCDESDNREEKYTKHKLSKKQINPKVKKYINFKELFKNGATKIIIEDKKYTQTYTK